MATTVESVDKLVKAPPQDRVNPPERSSSEQRRRFKNDLKREMSRKKSEPNEAIDQDAVELSEEPSAEEKRVSPEPTDTRAPETTINEDADEVAGRPQDHIDVKG
ncbi:MAG TPA: hypothetical protein VN285_09960 [Candidatus Deferrimicrobium sp.]|nr:hypothetical protein [Candidatus Deferrimicrobium sp.]